MWVRVFDDVEPMAAAATIRNRVIHFEDDRYRGRIDGEGNYVGDPEPMRSRRSAQADVKWLKLATRWASGRLPVKKVSKYRKRPYEYPDPQRLLPGDPLEDHSPTAPDKSKTRAANAKRYLYWRKRARSHRVAGRRSSLFALLIIANETGRRIGSIRHLRAEDVDLANVDRTNPYGTITWPAEFDKQSVEWERVPITRRARWALTRVMGPFIEPDAWLFPSPATPRVPVSKSLVGRWLAWVDKDLKPMGGNTKRWHSLRAKWATERKGRPLPEVAWTGGWENETTLLSFYQKIEPEKAYEVALAA